LKKLVFILLSLLLAITASASGSKGMAKHTSDICSISSGKSGGDKIYNFGPRSVKPHTFVKKNNWRVRYMKAEIRYTLSYFQEISVSYVPPVQRHQFFYSDPFNSDHHRLYKLRGPPAIS